MPRNCLRCGGSVGSGERTVSCPNCGFAYHQECVKGQPSNPAFRYGYICDNCHFQQDWGKKGCFIATAAYGTPMAQEINVLRKWRDEKLMKSISGRAFVKTYYFISPPIAYYISKSERRKSLMRKILKPLVKSVKEDI